VGKGKNFKFCTHSHGIDQNKSPLKMSGKLAVGVANPCRDSQKNSEHHIGYRAHRAVIFAIARLSCLLYSVQYDIIRSLLINITVLTAQSHTLNFRT